MVYTNTDILPYCGEIDVMERTPSNSGYSNALHYPETYQSHSVNGKYEYGMVYDGNNYYSNFRITFDSSVSGDVGTMQLHMFNPNYIGEWWASSEVITITSDGTDGQTATVTWGPHYASTYIKLEVKALYGKSFEITHVAKSTDNVNFADISESSDIPVTLGHNYVDECTYSTTIKYPNRRKSFDYYEIIRY